MSEIRGRRVLITGAASGMGLEMAREFARDGARPLLVDVNEEGLSRAGKELGAPTFTIDLTKPARIPELVQKVHADGGPIDILVNNAGVVTGGWLEEIPEAKDRLMLEVNVAAVHWMTKAFLPDLKEKREGHVVNMASAAGFVPVSQMVMYCASKSFVIGFTEALRVELDQLGLRRVRTTVVCPSYVSTGMFSGVKAPLLTPMLTPDFVAKRIVKAVKDDEQAVREPFIVKTTPVLKAILPPRVFERISRTIGATSSMQHWTGRH